MGQAGKSMKRTKILKCKYKVIYGIILAPNALLSMYGSLQANQAYEGGSSSTFAMEEIARNHRLAVEHVF